ncbi:hypothetical protein BGZ96_012453 [Linnemannia gamsii]|uniref:Uncharacterized protein n=1 Tax=Linnemannia gamsii TaxID=64522 RepID=A0ABQ7JQN0_9FUNG|nr:hypothetical protein BGZ96_012453 [Linnemannia gamsii]
MPSRPDHSAWSIIIKDIEYTGHLQVDRSKSLLSTRVVKELGLRVVDVVKPNTQQQAKGERRPASSTSSPSIVQTAALLPIQLASRESSKVMLSLEVGDVEYYNLLVGDDICSQYNVRFIGDDHCDLKGSNILG